MKKLAVFDIDGTIFRSSLVVELVDALIQEGIFKDKVSKVYAKSYQDWLERKDDYKKYIDDVVKAYINNIKGIEYKKYSRVANKVIDFHKNRVYKYTRDLVVDLKKRGYFLLAISHSPNEPVQKFAKELGFDEVYGRMFEIDKNNRLTGQMMYRDFIDNKGEVIKHVIKKHKLTLINSFGVGDTEQDIPVFKLVDHPICFNPNSKLYNYAKKKKWKVVVERKDVIYML